MLIFYREKLINEALSHITDDKLREKERAELEKTRKLTESIPQTTLPTTVKETNEPYTTETGATSSSSQITTTSSGTTVYKTTTITTNLPTTNEQTTAKLIVFERTTTPPSVAEESAIPESESESSDHEPHWITATPQTGPKIVTQIVDLEPVAQQQDNTGATVENSPITIFHRETTTIPPPESETEQTIEETKTTEVLPQTTIQQQPQTTVEEVKTTQFLPTTQEQQPSTYPPTTQQQTVTEIEESSSFITEANTQEAESTATPILILTQEQTNLPTTQSGVQTTGVTAELIVPHHAMNADSSESHPRTWKPRRNQTATTLHRSE